MERALAGAVFFAVVAASLAAQTVTVASPNGGESWQTGTPHAITWSSQNPGATKVNLILRNGGGVVGTIKSNVDLFAGSWAWASAGTLENGTVVAAGSGYIVRIRDAGNTFGDNSDAGFTLVPAAPPPGPQPTLQLTAPNGGETWKCGETRNITWTAANWSGMVQLNLYQDGAFKGAIASVVSVSGAYSWKVGATGSGTFFGPNCKVKVVKVYSGRVLPLHPLADESDSGFTVRPCMQIDHGNLHAALAKPDLVVCKAGPGQLTQENLCQPALACFNFTAKIVNIGSADSKECWLKIVFNGGGNASRRIAPLKPGASISWPLFINTHLDGTLADTYTVWIDEQNEVSESNEGNNILTGALSANVLEYGKCSDGKDH